MTRIRLKNQVRLTFFLLTVTLVLWSVNSFARTGESSGKVEKVDLKSFSMWSDHGKNAYQKGNYETSAINFEKALKSLDPELHVKKYLNTVIHLARSYQFLGYFKKAVAVIAPAVSYAEKIDDARLKAVFFVTLSDIHLSFGNIEDAARYVKNAVDPAIESKDPMIFANALNHAGNVMAADSDYQAAIETWTGALLQIEEIEEKGKKENENFSLSPSVITLKVRVLINISRLSFYDGMNKESLDAIHYGMLENARLPESHDKARHFLAIGMLTSEIRASLLAEYMDMKEMSELNKSLLNISWSSFEEARKISEKIESYRLASIALGYMGALYEREKRFEDAKTLTRRAMFHAHQGNYSDILYLWQWQMARLLRADGDTESAIKSCRQAIDTLNPIRSQLFKGYRVQKDIFNERVKPVYLELADLLLKKAEKESNTDNVEELLKQARDTMELLKTAELDDFFQDECATAMKGKIKTINRTDPHMVLLYPITLPDRIVLLITLPDGMKQISTKVKYAKLYDTVHRFRGRLQTRPNNRFLSDAQNLYDWMIRPFEADFARYEIDTIVVAPDGPLRLIPFSTLHDGKNFLVEKYAIATIPAISLTEQGALESGDKSILLAGLSDGVQDFSPLPSVTKELETIKEIMGGRVLLQNSNYTKERLSSEFKNSAYSIVHLATHGVFGGTPKDSFLLTYDSRLDMDSLESMIGYGKYRKPVQLLTLSACQTAMGNERAAMGLAGVAVKAGVRSAVATLWYVDDESTSLAIREFYKQLKKPGITKAKALGNAQKKLIEQPRYWHPLYWAPFLLIGNWQ
ncbi:CHAT domain-containing protein [Desulfobacterales bacterium HSG16]|nr:CHAT domain-containing protein [Desulfobacterales bacterium HSG16]